jgi:hypothetical protein
MLNIICPLIVLLIVIRRHTRKVDVMFVIIGFLISACAMSVGLIIRHMKHIRDAKVLKIKNDWRYSRKPEDLQNIPKLYDLGNAISVLNQLKHNGRSETRAYKYLKKSEHILVKYSGRYTIYIFDNLKLKVGYPFDIAVASMSELDGNENWISVNKDKDIKERVEQMLNRLIILLRKIEQDMKNKDDKKFLDQKAAILGSAEIKRVESCNTLSPILDNSTNSCDIVLHNPYE